jgi:hypothetical protein
MIEPLDADAAQAESIQIEPLRMQPTFKVELPWEMDDAKSRLRRVIEGHQDALGAEFAGWVFDYKIKKEDQRFWSPHLSIQLYRNEASGGSDAYCRFSPRPEIWTMVMAVYMISMCCLFAALVFGFVQWSLEQTPWALLVIPVSIAIVAGLHTASMVGQSWSRDQMLLLRERWERTVQMARDVQPTDVAASGSQSDLALN